MTPLRKGDRVEVSDADGRKELGRVVSVSTRGARAKLASGRMTLLGRKRWRRIDETSVPR